MGVEGGKVALNLHLSLGAGEMSRQKELNHSAITKG